MKEDILQWIDGIQQMDGIPAKEVVAFNFGIFEEEIGYTLYLIESFEYDKNDDDWACVELPTQLYRYLKLPAQFASENWEFVLDAITNTLKELEKEGKFNIPLFKNAIAITTGFDDGDLVRIK